MLRTTRIGLVKWIGMLLLCTSGILSGFAQAPDCDICDDLIDDPGDYMQCVEEHCNDAIPVDGHIWLLMIAGTGLAGYAFYRYQPTYKLSEGN